MLNWADECDSSEEYQEPTACPMDIKPDHVANEDNECVTKRTDNNSHMGVHTRHATQPPPSTGAHMSTVQDAKASHIVASGQRTIPDPPQYQSTAPVPPPHRSIGPHVRFQSTYRDPADSQAPSAYKYDARVVDKQPASHVGVRTSQVLTRPPVHHGSVQHNVQSNARRVGGTMTPSRNEWYANDRKCHERRSSQCTAPNNSTFGHTNNANGKPRHPDREKWCPLFNTSYGCTTVNCPFKHPTATCSHYWSRHRTCMYGKKCRFSHHRMHFR